MDKINKIMKKKIDKKNKLLSTSFNLFLEKGFNDTTIQDIVDRAGIAKGTFYLYFKDKYEIQDELITRQSKKLFDNALTKLDTSVITRFDDQIIFIINNVIDELAKNILLLKFISKNLSWGLYNAKVSDLMTKDTLGVRELFLLGIKKEKINLSDPDVTLFMIIELVSSTCFSSIIYEDPIDIKKFKPYLFDAIRKLLK